MTSPENPNIFMPSNNFDEEVNKAIIESEVEGGVKLENVEPGAELRFNTESGREYKVEFLGFNSSSNSYEAMVSGHPRYCPTPTRMAIVGSTFGGSMIKNGFIGRGMFLELAILEGEHADTMIKTTKITELEEVKK